MAPDTSLVMQFLNNSKMGYILFALDRPFEWNGAVDKEKALDYYMTHAAASFCNKAYLQLLTVDEKAVLQKTPADFFSFNIESAKASFRTLFDDGVQAIGAFETRPGVWLEGNNQCVYDAGGLLAGHISVIYDITHNKEDAHKKVNQEALKQISNYQYCLQPDGTGYFLDISSEFNELFGTGPKNAPNALANMLDFVYYADTQRVKETVLRSFAGISNIEVEFRINHPVKGIRWIKSIAIPDRKSDGSTIWNGYFTDCTASKKTHEWIGFLNTALMNISDAVMITNTFGEILYANRRASELHGYENDELIGRSPVMLLAQPATEAEQHEMVKTISDGKTYTNIGISRRKDGTTFTCEYATTPIFDENGAICAAIGIQNDITERIRMMDALKQSNERLRATLLSVGEGVISTDARGKIIVMNPVAEQMTGWLQEKAVGRELSEVFYTVNERTKKPFGDPAKVVLNTSASYRTVDPVLLISRSGVETPVDIEASPIKDDQGITTGAVIVFKDFSEYRERQRKIEYLSFHDPLTGLYNRRFMEDAVGNADLSSSLPLTIMVVDVNGLKLTNDAFGHKAGDRLLITVTEILKKTCRQEAVIARMGGDEFQILIPRTSLREAEQIKRDICREAASVTIDSVIVSLAIGFSVMNEPSESLDTIIMNADNQMYKEKLKHGKTMRSQTIETVLRNINFKFDREQIHTERVSQYSEAIAKAMGLSEQEVIDVKNAGVLHDIGKIVVPPELLNKPDKLTDEEYEIVKRHSEIGYQILKSSDEYAKLADFVLYHHERWDGRGYPQGLKATEIPLQARIISVADAFEAMTAIRSYQNTRTTAEATAELLRCSGQQFDSHIVEVFVNQVLGQACDA